LGVRIPPPLPIRGRESEANDMIPVKEWWPRTRDFFRDVWVEMKKTSWPGKSEVVGTTVVVIIACFLFGFYLFLVDTGLSWLMDKIFRATGVVA
jgi:preprotein translocase subunit SecE